MCGSLVVDGWLRWRWSCSFVLLPRQRDGRRRWWWWRSALSIFRNVRWVFQGTLVREIWSTFEHYSKVLSALLAGLLEFFPVFRCNRKIADFACLLPAFTCYIQYHTCVRRNEPFPFLSDWKWLGFIRHVGLLYRLTKPIKDRQSSSLFEKSSANRRNQRCTLALNSTFVTLIIVLLQKPALWLGSRWLDFMYAGIETTIVQWCGTPKPQECFLVNWWVLKDNDTRLYISKVFRMFL